MASFNIGDIVKVSSRLKFTPTGGDITNAWHFLCYTAGAATAAALQTAIQGWLDTVFANIASKVSSSVDAYDLKADKTVWNNVLDREEVVENLFLGPWTMASAPSAASESLPLQDAACVTLRTIRPKSRGRKFFPPYTESFSGPGGTVTGGDLTALQDAGADCLLDLTAGTAVFSPGVITPLAPSGDFLNFFSSVATPNFATQRRRRIGIGS